MPRTNRKQYSVQWKMTDSRQLYVLLSRQQRVRDVSRYAVGQCLTICRRVCICRSRHLRLVRPSLSIVIKVQFMTIVVFIVYECRNYDENTILQIIYKYGRRHCYNVSLVYAKYLFN